MAGVVGRFAPSPTGRLHLGNLRSALLGWLHARSLGGAFHLRIEDLDPDRSKAAAVDDIFSDLDFLGLGWDGPVLRQSQRGEAYREALELLRRAGRVYECGCSRAEIARAASAPHAGEDGPVYPGTCRGGASVPQGRQRSVRFKVRPGVTRVDDEVLGPLEQDVEQVVGDFVVQRTDGVASYQLAVVVDDAATGVTHVLRADDLRASTPRQAQLLEALGLPAPAWAHVPLLLTSDGKRLAKREGSTTLEGLGGVPATAIIGLLAKWSGLSDGSPCTAAELVPGFALSRVRRGPTVVDPLDLLALTR